MYNKIKQKIYLLGLLIMATLIANTAFSTEIIAHRGASGYLPEHTQEAVSFAYNQGANYIEQDVVLTKDNIPVVLHDIHLDANTNVAEVFPNRKRKDGKYYVIDFTLKEIKSLRVYERFNPKTGKAVFPNRFPAKTGSFLIPTLEEEILLIQGLNKSTKKNVGIYPEIKNPEFHRSEGKDISKIVINLLAKYGYKTKNDNFYLQIFSFDEIVKVRTELNFKGKLIQLITTNDDKYDSNLEKTDYDYLLTEKGIKDIAKYADGIGPWIPQLVENKNGVIKPSALVKLAKDNKLLIHPYTVRLDKIEVFTNINDLYNFLIANTNGFFTDFPDDAINYLKKQ